jgi:hypothetical protein
MPLTRPACSTYSISEHALRIYDTEGSLGCTLTFHAPTESRTPRRGFHLPQPAAHVRDRTLQLANAPEDHTVIARAHFHHADDGHPLPSPRRRRGRRARRGFRLGSWGLAPRSRILEDRLPLLPLLALGRDVGKDALGPHLRGDEPPYGQALGPQMRLFRRFRGEVYRIYRPRTPLNKGKSEARSPQELLAQRGLPWREAAGGSKIEPANGGRERL